MRSNHRLTAAARRWMAWVGQQPCINCGMPANVHHCAGATARHNKIAIGDWWILPLCRACHQGDHGIHGDLARFSHMSASLGELDRKQIEKRLFAVLLHLPRDKPGLPTGVLPAIEDYHL